MTYGFRPENWPAFQHQLRAREIAVSDIERVELRPARSPDAPVGAAAMVDVTVTLRSGRIESWSQPQTQLA